ncbi:MAG: SMC-Scp complex subunit ScpB [Candidatus Eisenbacteria bacterium]|nr:SMC-Scp complex subunit ScpB [Candidatus Latescibacterota bacterium]MBD3302142.1 SMC-Scp complex subunit ScpB [Candidatus Eisenbacteria bacterium]
MVAAGVDRHVPGDPRADAGGARGRPAGGTVRRPLAAARSLRSGIQRGETGAGRGGARAARVRVASSGPRRGSGRRDVARKRGGRRIVTPETKRILEAVLFAATGPQTTEQISLAIPDRPLDELEEILSDLRAEYEREERGWRLEEVAGGWLLTSDPALYAYVERFLEGRRRSRLSRAAMETLAVVAYRQPITRGELEEMRGVDCGAVLHTLLEREMITVRGRSDALGRPLIYGTTGRFLEHFGLPSLDALPKLEEFESLWDTDAVRTEVEEEAQRRFPEIVSVSEAEEQPPGDASPADRED